MSLKLVLTYAVSTTISLYALGIFALQFIHFCCLTLDSVVFIEFCLASFLLSKRLLSVSTFKTSRAQFRDWKGIFGIRDFTKRRCGIPENAKIS